jgi:hypothetical protein
MAASARGDVAVSLARDGVKIPFLSRHNTLSYMAAGAVAAAYGGDTSLVPKYIGFIYGNDASPTELSEVTDRDMRWDDVKAEMKRIGGNILICRFISTPELSTNYGPLDSTDSLDCNDEGGVYENNAVTFRSCTRSGAAGTYAFDTSSESGFAGEFDDGMYLYHAILLGDIPCQASSCQEEKKYTVLARVSLEKGGRFRKKPEDYELALDWKVSFF